MREAIVNLSDEQLDAMGMGDLISYTRAAGITQFEELDCTGDGGVVQVTVETKLDGDRLSAFDAVENWELVAENGESYRYLIEVASPSLSEEVSESVDELVGTCDATISDRGVKLSLVGPQETISETLRGYEADGISPNLDKLGDYEGDDDALGSLTERQREVVEAAYQMGFYEVPRQASVDDVASELRIDDSTVAEHLQRAERNLLTEQLAE